MANVSLRNIHKLYDNGHPAVNDFSLEIADGEFVVFVGPSGCGKSTTLRMIAGLEDISSGQLRIGDRLVNDLLPKERDIAMVFQSYALYPHMNVRQNMGFALKIGGIARAEIDRRVDEAAAMLKLEAVLDRRPRELSGGQRQRVALGRAIVRKPAAFLMDEPLSNLDAKLRVEMRASITRLHRSLGVTTIYVTHDQVEAMTMGDRIVVMRDGEIQQIDDPITLYERPANQFVGSFIGSPAMSFLAGELVGGKVRGNGFELTLPHPLAPHAGASDGRAVNLGVRPELIALKGCNDLSEQGNLLRARIDVVEPLGAETIVNLAIGEDQHLVARLHGHVPLKVGEHADFVIDLDKTHVFDAVSERNIGLV